MFKLYDLLCKGCGKKTEMMLEPSELAMARCTECGCDVLIYPNFGGYRVKGNNSASTQPRNSGSFKRGKNGNS